MWRRMDFSVRRQLQWLWVRKSLCTVSLLKALSLLGLGRERVFRVPVDGQGRMRPEALPSITGPTIICIQAGNV